MFQFSEHRTNSQKAGFGLLISVSQASLVAQTVKNLPAMRETWVQSLSWEDPLEKEKATDWRIPLTVQFTGSQRVRYD